MNESTGPRGEGGARERGARLSNQDIYEHIYNAISERRLPPGTKLSEEKLAKVFGISRTRLREVLCRLSQERIVTLYPNRGAFVAKPTVQETREVFAARRAIETAVVRVLATAAEARDIARLRQHLLREEEARQNRDWRCLTRLTGDFHSLLAELSRNSLFDEMIRRLVALTRLIIFLYESPSASACPDHEHRDLVEAIARRDPDGAADLLTQHLNHVEEGLHLLPESPEAIDLERIFANISG